MQVMGTNRWDMDVDQVTMMRQALRFADEVRAAGVADVKGAWIGEGDNIMWCSWDTKDLDGLKAAFEEMNRQTGLRSELTIVETFFSAIQETTAAA